MALVTEPAKLTGAVSWTVETHQHRGRLISMALSPDAKLAATAGVDGSIHIWELATGKLVRVIVGHNSHIMSVSWSPDGNTIASGGRGDSRIRLWDAHSGMPLRVFSAPNGRVDFVAWSADGTQLLAAGGESGWIWVWNVRSNEQRIVTETGQEVRSIHWSPSGEQVAVSIMEGAVSIVDVRSAKVVQTLDDPAKAHYCVRWSPDGKKLFVGSAGQSIIYDMPGGNVAETIASASFTAVWSPDGKVLCAASAGGKARLWGATRRKRPKAILLGGSELHWPTADQIVALDDTTITASQPDSGKQDYEYVVARTRPPLWTAGRPIITGLGSPKLVLWDNVTGQLLHTLTGHTGNIASAAWNRDGKLLATAAADKNVCLWDVASGKLLTTLKDHTGPLEAVAWSPDGKTLASGGYDPLIRLWQPSGKPIGELKGQAGAVTQLAWSPRGNLLASGGPDGSICLWRKDRKQLQTVLKPGTAIQTLAFSPDGSAIAAGTSEGFVQLWQTANGRPLPKTVLDQRRRAGGVNSLAWSLDGTRMLVACQGRRSIDLWNLQTSATQRLGTDVRGDYVAWSANGSLMVSGTRDSMVQFWDSRDSQLRGLIFDELDHIVLLSSNGNYRIDPAFQPQFLFVLQTETEQTNLTVPQFEAKYNWKNTPGQVTFAK
jgi:WD40 repeat protein